MKLKLSLRNLVKRGLLLNLTLLLTISGCSSSTSPTFLREDTATAVVNICRDEYKLDIKATLFGETLWIYFPVEDLLNKADKPTKYTEKFIIEDNQNEFRDRVFKLKYKIQDIPEQEKTQEYAYNKEVLEKTNNIWKVIRRVIFSMDSFKKHEPKFVSLVTADIKNGFEMSELFYTLDLKKVSYEFISWGEFQHRTIQDSSVSIEIIGDKEGSHLKFRDFSLEEFIVGQIKNRIKLKFQKPEVEKNVDIDKEILKIVVNTIKTYDFKDFDAVELNNLLTSNRTALNKAAIWSRPTD